MAHFKKRWFEALPEQMLERVEAMVRAQNPEGVLKLYRARHKWGYEEEDPNGGMTLLAAIALFVLRDFQEANILFEELLQKHDIGDEVVWWSCSRSLMLAQERARVISKFNKRWRQKLPNSREARYHQGILHMMGKRYEKAVKAFKKSLANPETPWGVRKPVILANKGQALLMIDKNEEALACCRQAIEEGGTSIPHVHRNLAAIHMKMDNLEAARKALQETAAFLENNSDNRNLDMDLGMLFSFIDEKSPLAKDVVKVVTAFINATSFNVNRTRIQRLLNALIRKGKLKFAKNIVDSLKQDQGRASGLFMPYKYAFRIFSMPTIRERNLAKKELLPEYRDAVEIILQMMVSATKVAELD